VPTVGCRTRKRLTDGLGALEKSLSPADVKAVESILPRDAIEGTRYAAALAKLPGNREVSLSNS